MSDDNQTRWLGIAARLAAQAGFLSPSHESALQTVDADGSIRRFFRLRFADNSSAILIAPGETSMAAQKEAQAAWLIGRHLADCGVQVPRLYAFDTASQALLCEDLGTVQLCQVAAGLNQHDPGDRQKLVALYQKVIKALLAMQLQAAAGFSPAWCCDTPVYDKNLMLARESGYFLHAFWQDLLGQEEPTALAGEFGQLASMAALAPARFFLHRDFQSRNIMICNGRPRFIDYQGGRLGPLGYDLASLLIDPYAGLDVPMRYELLGFYLAELQKQLPVDEEVFRRQFLALALQRNLQILGAFAFLSQRRGKSFFAAYLQPAIESLNHLLANETFHFLPTLTGCAQRAVELLEAKKMTA
jgi:aminoglycoside/choline kinase family phosphotransferase